MGVAMDEPKLMVMDVAQAEMFPELGLLEASREWEPGKVPERTGKILLKDWERCERVVDRILRGESQRDIAEAEKISRNSLRVIVENLTARGKLEPLKKRLSRRLGHIAEALSEDLLRDAESGALPANVKPIALGIVLDKKALLDGEPSQIVEVRRELSVEALEKVYLEAAKRAEARTIDIESSVLAGNAEEIGGVA